MTATIFPYDAAHQTFVTVYEHGAVASQAILDASQAELSYFAGSLKGGWAIARSLVPGWTLHVVLGPEHLLMLIGLLLMGGSRSQTILIASAFTLGHVVTVSLGVLNLASAPQRLVDPAIALGMVYIGVDNLMVRGGRDVRVWMSLAFGGIHGFGIASLLQSMPLGRAALAWSVVSFNVATEIGQVLAALFIAEAIAAIRRRRPDAWRGLVVAGSGIVIAAGTVWFVQRVFFPTWIG